MNDDNPYDPRNAARFEQPIAPPTPGPVPPEATYAPPVAPSAGAVAAAPPSVLARRPWVAAAALVGATVVAGAAGYGLAQQQQQGDAVRTSTGGDVVAPGTDQAIPGPGQAPGGQDQGGDQYQGDDDGFRGDDGQVTGPSQDQFGGGFGGATPGQGTGGAPSSSGGS